MQAKRKTQQTNEMNETQYVWRDRKRIFFGLPWTFTRYCLTGEKLLIDTGFLSRCEEEVWLYRILDLSTAAKSVGTDVSPWHHSLLCGGSISTGV